MNTVLVYRSELLPYSETFIKEQVLSYRRSCPVLVGRRLLGQLPLDGIDVRILDRPTGGVLNRVLAKATDHFGRPSWLTALQQKRPSLLHAHFGVDAIEAYPIARRLRIPLVVTLHGYDVNIHREWWESGAGGSSMRSYPRRLLKLSSYPDVHFLAVSDAIRNRAIEFGIPVAKLRTCYIGIDVSKFSPGSTPLSARERRILFVGRLVEKKGCHYLLEAMQLVKAEVPDAELIIIGDGPERAKLQSLADRLGIRAIFAGVCSNVQIIQELNTVCAFCLPSITAQNGDAEGFGIAVLEAQACGVPVVTSARGGAQEGILDGRTGFAFSERDVSDLAAKLVAILSNDALSQAMSAEGPRFVREKFDIRHCTENLEIEYVKLSERHDSKLST